MADVMRFAGQYMQHHPREQVISPLFFHYGLAVNPEMGSDYVFWKDYSRLLLSRCDKVIVYAHPDTHPEKSSGVMDEIQFAQELGLPILRMSQPQKEVSPPVIKMG